MPHMFANRPALPRFASALSDACPKPIYDQVLFAVCDCVAIPTLGSLLPNWMLLVPRAYALNFADWAQETRTDPADVVSSLIVRRGLDPTNVLWFEHGSGDFGSKVGCGVEHAHIHVIVDAPFQFQELVDEATSMKNLDWIEIGRQSPYSVLAGRRPYLVLSSAGRSVVAFDAEQAGSQYFRRAIARVVGQVDQWDYHRYPHLDNVRKTIARFGSVSETADVIQAL
jgi:ATP adenylyltransferase